MSRKNARFHGALWRARVAMIWIISCARVPHGWWSLHPSKTGHPFAVSSSEELSPKIECVFSASLETIRREPRESELLRSVGYRRDLAACASIDPDVFVFFLYQEKSFTLPRAAPPLWQAQSLVSCARPPACSKPSSLQLPALHGWDFLSPTREHGSSPVPVTLLVPAWPPR
jgi:hypothetical protein